MYTEGQSMNEKLVNSTVEEIKSVKEYWKEKSVNTLRGIIDLVVYVVKVVEKIASNGEIQKSDKKEFATKVLNKFLDIPYLPEWGEERVYGLVIGIVVDTVVATFNNALGKDWLNKV